MRTGTASTSRGLAVPPGNGSSRERATPSVPRARNASTRGAPYDVRPARSTPPAGTVHARWPLPASGVVPSMPNARWSTRRSAIFESRADVAGVLVLGLDALAGSGGSGSPPARPPPPPSRPVPSSPSPTVFAAPGAPDAHADGGRRHPRRVPDGQRLLLRRHRRAPHAGVSRLVDHHVDASSLPRRAVAADPPVAAAVVPGRASLYGGALQQHLPLNPSSVLDGRVDTSRSLRAWRPLAAGRVVPANPAAAPARRSAVARIEASATGRTTGRQPLRVGERPTPGSNRSVISGAS